MLPTLKVLLDNGAGTFPFDITTKVMALNGYEITRGREDWQSSVTAGQLTLNLNNSDGRFTPGSTIITSPSPIKVDQRIRLQETINGVTYTRFTGYVKAWPITWPGVVPSVAVVNITAVDAQARAERRPLRSAIEEEILFDSPSSYYTLGEAEGSTRAGDTSGSQAPALAPGGSGAAVIFGSGTGPTDGLTAAQFSGGQYLFRSGGTFIAAGSSYSLEVCFATSVTPASSATIAQVGTSSGGVIAANPVVQIGVSSTGKVTYLLATSAGTVSGTASAGPTVTDGNTHHAVLTYDVATTNFVLYIDSNNVASGSAFSSGLQSVATSMALGGDALVAIGGSALLPFTGTLSHVATYNAALSASRVFSHAFAVGNEFAGEFGTQRLTALAGYAGIPVGTLDTSLTRMSSASNYAGSTPAAEIQRTTDAEVGLAFIDGNGALTFHNRNRVVSKTVPDLTLGAQWITPDVAPILDDEQIVNYMEVTAEGTGGTSLIRNAASDTSHGRYPGSQSYTVQTDSEAVDRANWTVGNFAEPTSRYGTLTVNLYGMSAVLASTVIAALDLNCWLRVTSLASQNPGGTVADVVVQGWRETVSASSWTVTCNVVSRSLYAPVWIFDTSRFDTTTRFYI